MVRLNALFRSSLIKRARIMGAGKPKIRLYRLMSTVLRISLGKNGSLKKLIKSPVYDAIYDLETGMWREGPSGILEAYQAHPNEEH